MYLTTVDDATSYTDDDALRQDEETRMYRVGSEATGIDDPIWVAMPVSYALHGAHEPDAPTGVMAESSADGTMVTVSWTAPGSNGGSAITGYKVMYRMTGSDADYMSMDAAADATSATISDLTAGTDYDIVVVAVNAVGESAMAMATAMGMTHDVPGAPTGVMVVSSAAGTMATVSWTAPASDGGSAITGYKVMYKMTGSDADYMSMDAAADATSATISDLTPNTGYDIVVVAVNAVGESAMATAMGMTHDVPGAPTGVMVVSSAAGTMATVSWTAPASDGGSAITGYKVMYKMTGSDADYESMDAAADATSAVISGLAPNTDYDITVVAVNAVGESAMATGMGMTDDIVPGMPTGVTAESSADGTMLTVSWVAPAANGGSAITGYKVMYKMTGSDADYESMDAAADATSAVISGLTPNTGYDIAVVAVNGAGYSAMATAMGMTDDIVPGMPTSVTVMSSADGTMATVSWTAPADNGGSAITGYKVMYRMTGSDADYMSMDAAADATSAVISGLAPNTDYDITVVAVNAVGESAMATGMGMTDDIVPGMPTGVTAESSADGTMLTVSWVAPAANGGSAITGYKVMYKMTGSDADYESMDAAADATSAVISGLAPNTGYDIAVVAVNGAGYSAMATAMGMTNDIAPNAPSGVSAMADDMEGRTTINVSWMAPADNGGSAVTGYTLQRAYMMADDTMSEWMDVDPAHTGMDMMYMDTGLMPGITYYYRVLAMNAVGNSAWSDGMAMATTDAAAVPGMPMNVMAAATSDTMITVTWEAPASNGG